MRKKTKVKLRKKLKLGTNIDPHKNRRRKRMMRVRKKLSKQTRRKEVTKYLKKIVKWMMMCNNSQNFKNSVQIFSEELFSFSPFNSV
jgi:hypothetical protein